MKHCKKYDILIVGGPTKASGGRLGLLDNLDLFYLECPILIDDVHREDEFKIVKTISNILNQEYSIFESKNKKFAIL